MDKLKRVLSGNDDNVSDENRGIMGDVGVINITKRTYFIYFILQYIKKNINIHNDLN